MKDGMLYKICLAFSGLSIIFLFAFSYSIEPKSVKISDLESSDIGREVKISGTVQDRFLTESGEFLFELNEDGKSINVILFEEQLDKWKEVPENLVNGKKIKIEGEIKSYKKELQITPDKLVL